MTPASIRNNNPGAMYPGKSAKKFGSSSFETLVSKDGKHKIATFPTSIHGAAAQFDLLHRDYCGKTIEKAITTWCGGYYAGTYLKVLEDRAGIKKTDVLTQEMVRDHAVAIPIAKAMAWQEAGQDYPMSEMEWLEGHAMAFGEEKIAPAWNPRNDVPTPKWETRRDNMIDSVSTSFLRLGLVGGGGAAATTAPSWIPAVPDVLTSTLANLAAWKGALTQAGTIWEGYAAIGAGLLASILALPLAKKVMPK